MRYIATSTKDPVSASVTVQVGGPYPMSVTRKTKDSMWRDDASGMTLKTKCSVKEMRERVSYDAEERLRATEKFFNSFSKP